MAVVDGDYVRRYLSGAVVVPGLTFQLEPDDDESVDEEVKLLLQGVDVQVSVQVGGGYVVLNRYGYSRPGDPGSFYAQSLGDWGIQPGDLAELAKAVSLEVARLLRRAA